MSVERYDPNAYITPTLTPVAVDYLRQQLKRKGAEAVRFQVKKSGCNGYRYDLDYVDDTDLDAHADDLCVRADDVTLYVAKDLLPLVSGTQIDCVQEGLNKVIRYRNPMAEATCGCGESFAVSQP